MKEKNYYKIFFDFDSTIVACESLDLLADMKGIGEKVRKMTKLSMDGEIPLENIFRDKMDMLRPSKDNINTIVRKCRELFVENIENTISILHYFKKEIFILSSNFHCIVDPIVRQLKIPKCNVISNDLQFSKNNYIGIHKNSPLTTSRGKVDILAKYSKKGDGVVMIGDSVSDSFCKEVVDLFIGFGGVEKRSAVKNSSDAYIDNNILEIIPLILNNNEMKQLAKDKPYISKQIEILTTTTNST